MAHNMSLMIQVWFNHANLIGTVTSEDVRRGDYERRRLIAIRHWKQNSLTSSMDRCISAPKFWFHRHHHQALFSTDSSGKFYPLSYSLGVYSGVHAGSCVHIA
jgi:hypothetical protein